MSKSNAQAAAEARAARSFKKFYFRGVELEDLVKIHKDQLIQLVHARARRRFKRGLKRQYIDLLQKLRNAKKNTVIGEKPDAVNTHLRDMIIVPEMIGSVVGVYNGKVFNAVEIKPEMVGHYLAEFSLSYVPVRHGRPGLGGSKSSRYIPLK
eukprot:EC689876.1.p2 GENE.EC689876.1~~EC689876.1.p2  ORF type:complete len:177 (+),score=69.12 EC689876.1:76-531(+)